MMTPVTGDGLWKVETQVNDRGSSYEWTGVYFTYRGSTVGRFEGSIDNAIWMVTCINAALAAYAPLAEAVAKEAGFDSNLRMLMAAETTLDTTINP